MRRPAIRLVPMLVLALLLALGSACDESDADGDTPSGQGSSSAASEPTEDDGTPDEEPPADGDEEEETPADEGDGEMAERPQPPFPFDRSCSSDDDCVVTRTLVEGRWVCCGGCGLTAASRSWKQSFDRFCDENVPEPRTCPRYRCPMNEGRPRCRDGTCVVEPISDE